MSTTFAIIKNNKQVKVAHRYSLGGEIGNGRCAINWLDIKLTDALEIFKGVTSLNDVKVTPIDNNAQGVKTIRDLIKLDNNGRLNK